MATETPCLINLRYQDQIKQICSPLLARLGLSHFLMHISFNDNSSFTLANFDLQGASCAAADNGLPCPLCQLNSNPYTEEASEFLIQQAPLPLSYSITRGHVECCFFFAAFSKQTIPPSKQNLLFFEDFCSAFVEASLELIIQQNPNYKFSFILSNKSLRQAVIKQQYQKDIALTPREKECLLLASQGKKTKVIAKELQLSPYTIEGYLKNIRKSFNCDSITQAMFESVQRGIIGNILASETKMPDLQKLDMDNIFKYTSSLFYWKDKNSVYQGCNDEFLKLAGLESKEQVLGKTDFDLVWKNRAKIYRDIDKKVIETGIAYLNHETPITISNNQTITAVTNKIPLLDSQRQVIGVLGMTTNISNVSNLSYE